jgi:hypothetical protein
MQAYFRQSQQILLNNRLPCSMDDYEEPDEPEEVSKLSGLAAD